jgi:hypothetical protein
VAFILHPRSGVSFSGDPVPLTCDRDAGMTRALGALLPQARLMANDRPLNQVKLLWHLSIDTLHRHGDEIAGPG